METQSNGQDAFSQDALSQKIEGADDKYSW